MTFELSLLLPILALVVSIAAGYLWKSRYDQAFEKLMNAHLGSSRPREIGSINNFRIEVEPGTRLKSSNLKARDIELKISPI